jgi:NADH:ubiquinone oxidoreductase subunit 5 (subunit L)/multisubunit Na+/H+ antiporter MnhA subunit
MNKKLRQMQKNFEGIMKEILPNLFTFGLSLLMFGIAALQIFLGYTVSGKSGHKKKIFMEEEPIKFWTIVSLPIIVGLIAVLVGIISVWRKKKNEIR